MSDIGYNLEQIEMRITDACRRSGRERNEVTLIAVSKTRPVSDVEEAIRCGVREFGENKVQELTEKYDQVSLPAPDDIPVPDDYPVHWHLIGHLQRNKVKYVIGRTCLIHSVDSLRLAEEISVQSENRNIVCDVLAEVNIAGEDSKYGVLPEELLPFIEALAKLPGIRVKGLMTVAPFVENPEENRLYFRRMHELLIDIKSKNIDNVSMETLSMGMSGDFETAIEEGATMVRIGTSIFGERYYPPKA